MKRLYLHLGLHKTASSSFQAACKRNNKELRKNGFLYPLFNSEHINSVNISNHSVPLFSMFGDNPENYHINIKKGVVDVDRLNCDYFKVLESCLSSDFDLIVSGEDVSLLSVSSLHDLICFISKFDYKVVPFLLVRSPYDFHCSALQQRIKGGGCFNH